MSPRLVAAAAAGGAIGACLRYLLSAVWVPDPSPFPWTTFAINVVGSLLLAALPGLAMVRRSPTWTVALGPGVLGGFTTLSAYSEQSRGLLDAGRPVLAGLYLVGTLAACLAAVAVASRWSTPREQDVLAAEGGDE